MSTPPPPLMHSPTLARYPHAFNLATTNHREVVDRTVRRVLVAAEVFSFRKERGVTAFFKRRLREELTLLLLFIALVNRESVKMEHYSAFLKKLPEALRTKFTEEGGARMREILSSDDPLSRFLHAYSQDVILTPMRKTPLPSELGLDDSLAVARGWITKNFSGNVGPVTSVYWKREILPSIVDDPELAECTKKWARHLYDTSTTCTTTPTTRDSSQDLLILSYPRPMNSGQVLYNTCTLGIKVIGHILTMKLIEIPPCAELFKTGVAVLKQINAIFAKGAIMREQSNNARTPEVLTKLVADIGATLDELAALCLLLAELMPSTEALFEAVGDDRAVQDFLGDFLFDLEIMHRSTGVLRVHLVWLRSNVQMHMICSRLLAISLSTGRTFL